MSDDGKVKVDAKAVGIREDSLLIFKLKTKDHGNIGPEKAKELGLLDMGYEYGEWDDYLPVVDDEQDVDEPVKTKGYVNKNQAIRGNLNI